MAVQILGLEDSFKFTKIQLQEWELVIDTQKFS
jgi:hypothetical protein